MTEHSEDGILCEAEGRSAPDTEYTVNCGKCMSGLYHLRGMLQTFFFTAAWVGSDSCGLDCLVGFKVVFGHNLIVMRTVSLRTLQKWRFLQHTFSEIHTLFSHRDSRGSCHFSLKTLSGKSRDTVFTDSVFQSWERTGMANGHLVSGPIEASFQMYISLWRILLLSLRLSEE